MTPSPSRGAACRLAADNLLVVLRRLVPQIEDLLADDWGADIHRRLREYALQVIADLELARYQGEGVGDVLTHLEELGTDLALHRSLAHWDVGERWNQTLAEAEEAAARFRNLMRAAA